MTHGFGTLVGAVGGAVAAFFKGGALPDLGFSLGGGLKLESTDGQALAVGPPKSDNFAWILLDSCLNYYLQIVSRTHAQRDGVALLHDGRSLTRELTTEQRQPLAKWFASCVKGKPERSIEPKVFEAIHTALRTLNGSHTS